MPALADLADGQSGWVHPGATPLAADHASLGVGLANVTETYFGIASGDFHFQESAGALVRGLWAPIDRLLVTGAGGVYPLDLDVTATCRHMARVVRAGQVAQGGSAHRPTWSLLPKAEARRAAGASGG